MSSVLNFKTTGGVSAGEMEDYMIAINIVTEDEMKGIVRDKKPEGLFLSIEGLVTACDNSTGDARTADFEEVEDALVYLMNS